LKRYFCLFFLVSAITQGQSKVAPPADGSLLNPLNRELPAWLRLSGEYRIRAEGYTGGGYTPGNNQGYLLSRLQLNMDLRLRWFHVFAQGQDARVLGNDAIPAAVPYQDRFDLRQAFVEFGDSEKGRFALRAGRQELKFGDERIIGIANWRNTPRSFDAVRADIDFGKVRVDAFSASVVNPIDGRFDHSRAGDNLHGLYGSISEISPGAVIEPYFLWHVGGGFKTESGVAARRSTKTVALRFARRPLERVDYEVQLLRQFGSIGSDTVRAYAMNFALGYTWSRIPVKPRAFFDYAYASGDNDPRDGRVNTFDQIYPSNHGIYGAVDLFGFQNLQDAKCGLELKPNGRLTIATVFHHLNLANGHDALYNGAGTAVARDTSGSAGIHIGNEWEGTGTFHVTDYLTGGAGYGRLFPGEYLKKATKGSSNSISYLFFSYAF
jgi:hypothetical protein